MTDYRDRLYSRYGHFFQDSPVHFDASAADRWGRQHRRMLRGWLPTASEARIGEIACGGGWLLRLFRVMGYTQVEGCDRSPDQVALARQVVPDVVQGDALAYLAERPGRFDLIVAFDVIEHLTKDEVLRFLDLALIALRPGGRLILHTPNADGPWGASLRYGDFTHEVGFNPNSLGRLLRLTGFSDIESRECAPTPWGHSLISTVRAGLWQVLRLHLLAWNLIETGTAGSGVFTRVFLISARRT